MLTTRGLLAVLALSALLVAGPKSWSCCCCGAFVSATDGEDATTTPRAALEALYWATGGPNWFRRCQCADDGVCWLQPNVSHCRWNGVCCTNPPDRKQFFLRLLFLARSLTHLGGCGAVRCIGSIVTRLKLDACNLTGELPADLFGTLPTLGAVSLMNNSLRGHIPPVTPHVAELLLKNNAFAGPFPV